MSGTVTENQLTLDHAQELDRTDPLAGLRDSFVGSDDPDVTAYLDGNSLGRPLKASAERISQFVTAQWGSRLIRGWDEGWMAMPQTIGDAIGSTVLGAAASQVTVGDSTTVMLYKLCRAAVAARPQRRQIVLDRDNFPTDRYVLEGIARECGLELRWITPAPDAGVTADQLASVVGEQTALVVLSLVAYRSGYLADGAELTRIAHDAGALILWDLCHSVGVVPTELDAWGVDLAVGCTYKYLNGGPGAPAFGYVNQALHGQLSQPIQGWIGSADPFGMAQDYRPGEGIRGFTSGTPPVLGMLAMQDMVELIGSVGLDAVRAKSIALTEYAITLYDGVLARRGVSLSSPRAAERRGSHITVDHQRFRAVTEALWQTGVIPDFRNPDGIRLGFSPLSTSFTEVWRGVDAIRAELG